MSEMHDIERLIVRLPRPSPSTDLDERMRHTLWAAARPTHANTKAQRVAKLACTALCAGLIGYFVGRHSATTPPGASGLVPVMQSQAVVAEPPQITAQVDTEALAHLVMPPKRFVGLWGDGPLEVHISSPVME